MVRDGWPVAPAWAGVVRTSDVRRLARARVVGLLEADLAAVDGVLLDSADLSSGDLRVLAVEVDRLVRLVRYQ